MNPQELLVGDLGRVETPHHVEQPGRYQFNEGLTVRELLELAHGPWPDVLLVVASRPES